MPITKTEEWENSVKINDDPYGKAAVDVARRAMEILDEELGDVDCHDLICRADDDVKTGGITGFMAGCVASMISQYHSRGNEFRLKWNKHYDIKEDEAKGGIVNPAILTIKEK